MGERFSTAVHIAIDYGNINYRYFITIIGRQVYSRFKLNDTSKRSTVRTTGSSSPWAFIFITL